MGQGKTMATNPERPKSTTPSTGSRSSDFLLDPLPVPEALESDSDTAWGLWQDSVQTLDAQDTHFDPTVPGELHPSDDDSADKRKP